MKKIFLYSSLIIISLSCDMRKSDKIVTDDFHCSSSDDSLICITGNLTLDSKGNALVDFVDTIYNGKIKIVGKETYKSIYDAFLSLKNIENSEFKVSVYGHYIPPIDTITWLVRRRNFHAHKMSFLE